MPATEFVGYDHSECDAKIVAIVADEELRDEVAAGAEAVVVLDQSPFYAEMGGQVADHGTITADGVVFTVADVQKNKGGKFMHYGRLAQGVLHVGDTVHAAIDMERRKAIQRAHSTTHLLDTALKKVLGDHVHQAGSLVEPDRLRFDFTHFEAISPEELRQVEELVNDAILEGYPVVTEILPIEEAKKKGAVAMFGEKYGETVRVVEMSDFSVEFCGGTHVDNTAKAGPFRIKSESSVASGVVALALLLKDILIAIIVSVYLLARKDVFAAQSKKIVYSVFRTDVADLLVEETRSAYRILSGFINGKLVDSLIIGIIALVCCNLFRFPYPMLLAVIIGVTNIIPFFGPFIGAIPCALLILLVSPLKCLYFVIFIFVLQQFDGNILGPKILGDSTGLASFWVLFSILLFGGLFGFVGMVLGVPVFAMFYSVVSRLVRCGLKKRGLPLETEQYLGRTGPLAGTGPGVGGSGTR